MLGSALKDAGDIVGRRSLLSTVLPSSAFCGLALLLVASTETDRGIAATIRSWDGQPALLHVVHVAAFLGVVGLLAMFLTAALGSLLHLYEGYWHECFTGRLANVGRRAHREAMKGLMDAGGEHADTVLYRRYPMNPRDAVATSLGNVLRSAETYPKSRYGIDATLVWTRLYHVLPEPATKSVASARARLEKMIVVSFLSGTLGTAGAVYLISRSAAWTAFLLYWWGGHALAYMTYRAATSQAIILAEHVKASFDLYRHALVEQLQEELPNEQDAERKYWITLGQFWLGGVPRNAHREPEDEQQAAPMRERSEVENNRRHRLRRWLTRQTLSRWFVLVSVLLGLPGAFFLA